MTELKPTTCCGLAEVDGLSQSKTPKDALMSIWRNLMDGQKNELVGRMHYGRPPFVLLSTVTKKVTAGHGSDRKDDYGQAFAMYIIENGLGEITASGERTNHTGNGLMIWIWEPDYEALVWWKKDQDKLIN